MRAVDVERVPASAYLGVLGMPGMTAYVGLTRIAPVQEGETVFVSGAAGAVGSAAGQMARLLGAAKVVGSAGSPEKVAWVTGDLGFDAACGAIATYNETDPSPGPRNMFLVVTRRISIRGFIVMDHGDVAGEFYRRAGDWFADGRLTHQETIVDGLDATIDAFLDLHRGA